MRTNEPDMNIVNQINAALADVRATLVDMVGRIDNEDRYTSQAQAKFQLELAIKMVNDHSDGIASIPWSDRKHIVDEEFS